MSITGLTADKIRFRRYGFYRGVLLAPWVAFRGMESRPLDGVTTSEVRRAEVCRGAQALNVARGGTLHQHLPAITDHTVEHRQTAPGWEETHTVRVEPGSRLASVLGPDAPGTSA
jgi:peptidase C26-like protein